MAREKKEETSKKSKLDAVLEALDKQYGKGSVLTLDTKNNVEYETYSTGSLGFDNNTLGTNGVVKGKLYELMGWEGTGKSTICGQIVASCQKAGGKAAYIDGEHAVDKTYFQALGVDTSKMLLSQPSSGEEGFNIAMELMKSGEIDLIIIDSDSSLIPKKVLDGDVGDSAIGRKALLNSNAYPKLKTVLSEYNVCVIVISQYREKIGVMFGNPTTTQGGHALKFYSDVRIEVSKSQAKDGDVVYGNITKVKTIKNKMSAPFKTTSFEIVYGKGIDSFKEILEYAVEFDIVKKAGSWYSYGETRIGQGLSSVVELLSDNPELFEEIKQMVLNNFNKKEIVETREKSANLPKALLLTPVLPSEAFEKTDDNQLTLL
jgi:recombination protein RecA